MVKYLHQNGVSIYEENNYALYMAAANGHLDVVRYLRENGVFNCIEDNEALKYAAVNGQLDMMKYLHQNGANLSSIESYYIRKIKEYGYENILEYVQEHI